ncbi:hypothetical protein Vadar_001022 [Vaccinium darrowii]|uniref:Uncharacterized protein n=1 Tax=Vaccinium darrowii TaxID=229202 RepID=A0ACB7ZHN6_9ERIC|nr:hypothetical protein Vadar_001022 [Vaccinium darrowii]
MAKVEEANSVKPEKFHGQNFERWQKQTKYWLTMLGLVSALEDKEAVGSWLTPEQIEFHCFNRILSALSDRLYDVYHSTTTTAKELWKTLEAEYGTVDAGIERFTASNFNGYKLKDEKPVGDQIHEFQKVLRGVEKKGTTFSEELKVSCLIDKLPPSWNDFARGLRHKQGDLSLTQLINTLRVEEKHRSSVEIRNEKTAKVNLVENEKKDSSNNRNKYKAKGKNFKNNNKGKYRNHHNQVHKKKNEHKPRYHNGQDRKGQNGDVNMVMEEKEIVENQVEKV